MNTFCYVTKENESKNKHFEPSQQFLTIDFWKYNNMISDHRDFNLKNHVNK